MRRANNEIVFVFGEQMGLRIRHALIVARKLEMQVRGELRRFGNRARADFSEPPKLSFTGPFRQV